MPDVLSVRKELVLPVVETHSCYTSRRTGIAPKRRRCVESGAVQRRPGSIVPDRLAIAFARKCARNAVTVEEPAHFLVSGR